MSIVPIVKWAGGKRQLLPVIREILPETYNTYYEPFLGGGAVFCDLAPERAVVSDINRRLIDLYVSIRDNPDAVMQAADILQGGYNSLQDQAARDQLYYAFRDAFNVTASGTPAAAALLLFLNRAGFNGLYRENSSGTYNVPPAHRKSVTLYARENLERISELLKRTEILCVDFEKACKTASEGDLVFLDSPYYGVFDDYQRQGFPDKDHERLARLYRDLDKRGCYCILTGSDSDYIRELYDRYKIREVDVKRMINCDASKRTGKELIITNY